jgi:flagellar protein FlaG
LDKTSSSKIDSKFEPITNDKLEVSSENEERDVLSDSVKLDLERVNNFIPLTSTNLSFEFDEEGNPPFIRVVDKDSNEVIREIPSEDFREVAKALNDLADKISGKGVLIDKTI